MSTTTKNVLNALATAAFAIAAAATTVTSAFAQTSSSAAPATSAAKAAVASGAAAASKAAQQSGLTREQVRAEVIEARKNGTLMETEADYDVANLNQHKAK